MEDVVTTTTQFSFATCSFATMYLGEDGHEPFVSGCAALVLLHLILLQRPIALTRVPERLYETSTFISMILQPSISAHLS